jgi:hypothetical protein
MRRTGWMDDSGSGVRNRNFRLWLWDTAAGFSRLFAGKRGEVSRRNDARGAFGADDD